MARTIEELERENWGEPDAAGWPLIERCLRLRRKPINQFSVEDLQLMIGQDIGTKFLLPVALDLLELNPFAEGDCYPGDLLVAAFKLSGDYWLRDRAQLDRAIGIAHVGLEMLEGGGENHLFNQKLRSLLRGFIWQYAKKTTDSLLSVYYEPIR